MSRNIFLMPFRTIFLKEGFSGMNRIAATVVSLGIALSAGFSAAAQEHRKSAAELREEAEAIRAEEHRQELVNLEKEGARALQQGSGTFFRRVYSEDFVSTGPYGQTMDRSAFITAVEGSQGKYSSVLASDIKVRIFDTTAVVTCLWTVRGSSGGRPFSRQSRMTRVYIYGQRGWKVVANQETLLPG